MENELKGLPVQIIRGKYTAGGSINKFHNLHELILIIPLRAIGFPATEERPAVKIVKRKIQGKEYVHAEPVEPGSYAFGGSFIYTSDSRFWEICGYPIPLHDRQMNLEK